MVQVADTPHQRALWVHATQGLIALGYMLLVLAVEATPHHQATQSGGDATVAATSRQAFSQPIPGLSSAQQTQFFVGNSFFNRNWVTAPASTQARDGLGPLFNARSCSGCHRHDGRGRPPQRPGDPMVSMLIRLGLPRYAPHHGVIPEPTYGDQLNNRAIPGIEPEGHVKITYETITRRFADGEPYQLQRPMYTLIDLRYGPLHPDVRLSPRTAPFMIGLGLLEAIPEAAILALADPHDRDGDGISGRPNRVWDATRQQQVLGRFGWKANQPTVAQQTTAAFLGDIGITSALFPQENCTARQLQCQAAPTGGQPEIAPELLDHVIFYSRTLAVPARRTPNYPVIQRGELLFAQSQCTRCHLPTLQTGTVDGLPNLSNQTIHPYTDLLLHDMGEELADRRPDFEASGREWRTPPLWGIGLVPKVNGHTRFLHDGRARNLTEAILWHGGEATTSREHFRHLSRADRAALIQFLESL
ncbi:hypothetical protein NKDENANG_04146 [Candidatus Entotheonellaceae bacterium PAL068K]